MGSGLAAEVVSELEPASAGLVLCEPYTTLREAGARLARQAGFLNFLLPNVWRTVDRVRELRLPMLIVHSDADSLFPVAMAEALHAAASRSGAQIECAIVAGFRHNAVYLEVPPRYWQPILKFLYQLSREQAKGPGYGLTLAEPFDTLKRL